MKNMSSICYHVVEMKYSHLNLSNFISSDYYGVEIYTI